MKNTGSQKLSDTEAELFAGNEFARACNSFDRQKEYDNFEIKTAVSLDRIAYKISNSKGKNKLLIAREIESLKESLNKEVAKGYISKRALEISKIIDILINEYNRLNYKM